ESRAVFKCKSKYLKATPRGLPRRPRWIARSARRNWTPRPWFRGSYGRVQEIRSRWRRRDNDSQQQRRRALQRQGRWFEARDREGRSVESLAGLVEGGYCAWNHKLVSLQPSKTGTKVVLSFANGVSETVDFVVGADGAWSKVRPHLSSVSPAYTGVSFFDITLPKTTVHSLPIGGFFPWMERVQVSAA
ncbi:hypothetical protein BCR33DRAFT_560369, partial [Rhizoclosmatium globosum]